MELFPSFLSSFELFMLILSYFLGAAISTSIGAGGGLIVIASMSLFLPISALLPLHAIVQSGAGILRAFLFRKLFLVHFFFLFMLGSSIGYFFASHFLITLPDYILKLFLGLGIIILTFLPKFKMMNITNSKIITLGMVTGFLTLFIGVMGPILAIFLVSFVKERHIIVGTIAWCMAFQNMGKAIIFMNIGFEYKSWIILICVLIVFSYVGVMVGKMLLNKNSNEKFKKILRFFILFLGLKLIVEALFLIFNT